MPRRRQLPHTPESAPAPPPSDEGGRAAPEPPSAPPPELGAWRVPTHVDMLIPYVLLAVSLQRAHGYLIEEYLRGLGFLSLEMSTLYRTLRQMEKEGLLDSSWEPGPAGPARRVYNLTDTGREWLESWAGILEAYRGMIDRFFGLYGDRARRADADRP